MSETKAFRHITPEIFACSKKYIEETYRGSYVPADASKGTMTMSIPGHFPAPDTKFELEFDYNQLIEDLRYVLVKKDGYLPNDAAWSTIEDGITGCRGKKLKSKT
jgi:hypothetical protein